MTRKISDDKKIQIKYSISLWNYLHYPDAPDIETVIKLLSEQGYGIELWQSWGNGKNLLDQAERNKLKPLLQNMEISYHSAGVDTFDLHKKQIELAADVGAKVLVLHTSELLSKNSSTLDVQLAHQVVNYAQEYGITVALENGELAFLVDAVEKVQRLDICFDIGHVYLTQDPVNKFLDNLKDRITHLHIHDVFPENEVTAHNGFKQHYTPGTAKIPDADWQLLAKTLKEIDFNGMAVFEIAPQDPLLTAFKAKTFMQKFMERI